MKHLSLLIALAATCTALLISEADAAADTGRRRSAGPAIHLKSSFSNGASGWQSGFSDYSLQSSGMELESGIEQLPPELGSSETAFRISGHNRSDDLFMFLKRKVTGLQPGATYQVTFRITLASNAGSGCAGIGGAPGEAVMLKAGASEIEPLSVLNSDLFYRMNVDIGGQRLGGSAASAVGNIANGRDDCRGNAPFVAIERLHTHTTAVRANGLGELWLLVGTDSGFEGKTTLYYRSIDVQLLRRSAGAVATAWELNPQ
ncbi:MAG TPA: hypothetical protein VNM92_14635 [Thermoanaerobaculia bacterium]|nr:hypothetical protein [Thermoanaerobaculia bacterium]